MGDEQFPQVDGSPFFGWPSSSGFTGPGLFKCSTGLFCFGNDFHARIPTAVKRVQFFECWDSEETPVQQKQGISKSTDGMVSVFHHLHDMGHTADRCILPPPGSLKTVMEPDA